MGKNMVLKSQQ